MEKDKMRSLAGILVMAGILVGVVIIAYLTGRGDAVRKAIMSKNALPAIILASAIGVAAYYISRIIIGRRPLDEGKTCAGWIVLSLSILFMIQLSSLWNPIIILTIIGIAVIVYNYWRRPREVKESTKSPGS